MGKTTKTKKVEKEPAEQGSAPASPGRKPVMDPTGTSVMAREYLTRDQREDMTLYEWLEKKSQEERKPQA